MNTPAIKKRPRRIAADEAHAWARNLRLKNSLGKLVLCMLTGYVNSEGVCFVGIETLGDDTELSSDTVRKRLAWLEHVGVIARFPQWIDAAGRRNGDGRGKRTSDEIRLLLDADPDVVEARASGDESVTYDEDSSPRSQQGLNPDGPMPAPQLAPEQPSDSGKGHNEPEPEPEDSPQPPFGGSEPEPDGWKEFQEAYPSPILRQQMAQTAWRALTPTECDIATKAARGYGQWLKAQRKPPNVLGAHLFLKERDAWPQYAERSETTAQRKTVSQDCDEARAYMAIRSLAGAVPPPIASDGSLGLPRALTPAELAFRKLPDRAKWQLVEQQSQQASWLGFLEKALPEHTARRQIVVDHRGSDGLTHRGFLAPWPWPPTKEGHVTEWPEKPKTESTGPPASAA